ncbi:MAG: hypothetical protein IPG92_15620 [Flavobacteriales bacterium]|nr:hypothetical protein [Flavobacteriales bacterium]
MEAPPTNVVFNVYATEDVNLDSDVKYTGPFNDRDPILVNIGGTVPTAQRFEQLPEPRSPDETRPHTINARIALLSPIASFHIAASAQQSVDIGLYEAEDGALEIRVTPATDLDGVLSNLSFTLAWDKMKLPPRSGRPCRTMRPEPPPLFLPLVASTRSAPPATASIRSLA